MDFHGKHYTLYEAEQLQRRYETEMRKEREQGNLYKQVKEGDPALEHDYRKSKERLAGLREGYKELGATLAPHSIREKWERSYVPKGSTGSAKMPQPDYKQVTPKVREEFQDKANQIFHAAPESQQLALKGYTQTDYVSMNKYLYGDDYYKSAKTEKQIKDLDKITDKYILDRDIISWRKTESQYYTDWEVGKTYSIPAFISTTVDRNNEILGAVDDFIIEIRIRKGTKGMYLGTLSEHKREAEFLLGRDLRYKVINKTNDRMTVEVSNG